MSKKIEFVIPLDVDDSYDLQSQHLKRIRQPFDELYPNSNFVIYYYDEFEKHRYFVSGWYPDLLHGTNKVREFSKIVELPRDFSLEQVVDAIGIEGLKSNNIKTLTKL